MKLIFYFFILSLCSLSGADDFDENFKIDDDFRKANSIDFDKLYSKKPVNQRRKSNPEAEIQKGDLLKGQSRPGKIEIIVDSSGSMGQLLGPNYTRMYSVKKVVAKYLLDQWKRKDQVGLRVYGSRRRNDCSDNYLTIPFGENRLDQIERSISFLLPIGRTPLFASVEAAKNDLKSFPGKKAIVVFTDGKETCGGDLCEFAKKLREDTSIDIKVFTVAVGFNLKEKNYKGIQCLQGLGASSSASDEDDLIKALAEASDFVNEDNNFNIVAPNPDFQANIYRIENGQKKLFKTFTVAWGISLPPGKYEAVVLSKPNYKFPEFEILEGKKVTLTMKGSGRVGVNFAKGLLSVELLDKNGKIVKTFPSGVMRQIPMGVYQVRLKRIPFFEETLPDIEVLPGGTYKLDPESARSVVFQHEQTKGFYIYDENKELIGNFLTNTVLVLPYENYTFYESKNCLIEDVRLGQGQKIEKVNCKKQKAKQK